MLSYILGGEKNVASNKKKTIFVGEQHSLNNNFLHLIVFTSLSVSISIIRRIVLKKKKLKHKQKNEEEMKKWEAIVK